MQLDPTGELAFIESISSEELPIKIVLKLILYLINIYDHKDKNINL